MSDEPAVVPGDGPIERHIDVSDECRVSCGGPESVVLSPSGDAEDTWSVVVWFVSLAWSCDAVVT